MTQQEKRQSVSQHEKRRSVRKALTPLVQVLDVVMGETIGQLGNLSPEGLMLITSDPIAEGSIFQLQFALTDMHGDEHFFTPGATCLWSQESSSGAYWSGFQIIDLSDDQSELLRDLYNLM